MATCARCGHDNQDHLAFCLSCGAELRPFGGLPMPSSMPPPTPGSRGAGITVTDHAIARQVGDGIVLGNSFVFLPPDLLDRPSLRWIRTLVPAAAAQPRVLSRFVAIELPGVELAALDRPALGTAVVTSDKALYREGADVVHLLACDPLGGDRELELELELNGALFGRRPVRLTAAGAGALALRDLPCGDYEVRVRGAAKADPACAFTVAEYRLSPLVAALDRQARDGDRLALDVTLTAFGVPVTGEVHVELLDAGRRLDRVTRAARDGKLDVALALRGDGPHTVNFQLAADPGRTATIPLVGSRAAERTDTVFSTLGPEVLGTLLPSDGAREVRGIHLRRGGTTSAPVRLDRVDTRRATLTAMADLPALTVAIVDPTLAPRPGAIDVATAPHPGHDDEAYRRGEQQFGAGDLAGALATFVAARAALGRPHPNYAYFIACCHARRGDRAAALGALRAALRDGWTDLAHLRADDDLAALRGDPAFEAIARGGVRVLEAAPKQGETIAIELDGPLAYLAVGTFVDGQAWEGHAAIVAPPSTELALDVPARAEPGGALAIGVRTAAPAVYVIVKDARLLSADTPTSRLAGQLKAHVEAMRRRALGTGVVRDALAAFLPPPLPPPPVYAMPSMPPSMPMGLGMPLAAAAGAPRDGGAIRTMMVGGMPGAALPGAAMPRPAPLGAPATLERAVGGEAAAPPGRGATRARAAIDDAPEVVFAGLIEVRGGAATVTVELGPAFADYVVEAFAIDGADWAAATARLRAERIVFASFELPPFVHAGDTALGRLVVGGGGAGMTVEVTRDGAPVALVHAGEPAGPTVRGPRAELELLVAPGDYHARVVDAATGEAFEARARVDQPGKLRRLARSVRLLRAGERIARRDDPAILSLRGLPGLDQPFKLLCDATASYGHACCEQTAAKLLAACTMYLFAGDDGSRRARAEEIVIAGVRRERSMFLPRRGFKMYPESRDAPDTYWGPKAARYLWNLDLLRPAAGRALAAAIDDGLEMARDATAAYKLAWPPRRASTPEDAYAAVRFGDDRRARDAAVDVLRKWAADPRPTGHGAVGLRADTAYAAAGLLRGGGDALLPQALALANRVVAELGPDGRLYSTVDSVAAIALVSELDAAGVVGEGGAHAEGYADEIAADRATRAVEVTRWVDDDWDKFAAGVPVTVTVRSNGRATARVTLGDPVELVVKLDGGYQAGDLVWVALPDALTRVVGGGQVKRFSVDLRGQPEVTIPLAATNVTVDRAGDEAPQRFAVCVRNMFEEERAGNPGPLDITVVPPRGDGLAARAVAALRRLIS